MKILTIFLHFKRGSIESEIDTFKEYLLDINNFANREKQKLKKMVEDMAAKNPKDSAEIYDHYSDQYMTYETKYVELANNGSLVNSYSFFEHQLRDIVRTLKSFITKPKDSFTYLKNLSYVENLRREISAISGLDFSTLNADWTELDKFRKIRNLIVHNRASLFEVQGKPLTKQKHYSLLSTFSDIKINTNNGDFFITDQKLVLTYFDLVRKYLRNVLDTLEKLDDGDFR